MTNYVATYNYNFIVVGDALYRVNIATGQTWKCDGWNWHDVKEPDVTATA